MRCSRTKFDTATAVLNYWPKPAIGIALPRRDCGSYQDKRDAAATGSEQILMAQERRRDGEAAKFAKSKSPAEAGRANPR